MQSKGLSRVFSNTAPPSPALLEPTGHMLPGAVLLRLLLHLVLTPSRLAQQFLVRPVPTTLFQTASPLSHSHLPCVCVKSLQLCPALCDVVDCSPPGSSVHRIPQARIVLWVAMPSSRGSSQPGIELTSLTSLALSGRFFTTSATWEAPHECWVLFIPLLYFSLY